MNEEVRMVLNAHKDLLEIQYAANPEIEMRQYMIARFVSQHPQLNGLSYSCVEILMHERNARIAIEAINRVGIEIKERRDVQSKNFRLIYRNVTESRVREILKKVRAEFSEEIIIKGPHTRVLNTRKSIASFRTTEAGEDAITYLSACCNISRSSLVNALLVIEEQFSKGTLRS